MKKVLNVLFAAALVVTASSAVAQKDPMVGGAAMYPNKNIVENASQAPNLSTLVTAVKAAGLVETLEGPGPFTVFAPTNDAFNKLPAGTVQNLLKPENVDQLKKILTYHVVSGKVSAADLKKMITDGGGKATLTTVEGDPLTASIMHGKVVLTDAKGGKAVVTTPNVYQSNGVVHVINAVLLP
jgi:uncharacterized surface protein with fasciclin (FAS1) repeats